MKKIGIITYHFAHNYGAVLQTYATKTVLEKLGANSEVIDYAPKYHTEIYAPKRDIKFAFIHKFKNKSAHKSGAIRILSAIKSIYTNYKFNKTGVEDRENKMVIYKSFVDEFLKLSRRYSTLSELIENSPEYDGIVAGSDQIWNWRLTNQEYDDAYFLQFGKEDMKRCIYATSIGNTTVEECYSHVKDLAIALNHISFREKPVCDRYNGLSKANCIDVCDPTLLLFAQDYDEISKNKYMLLEPYILAYILVENPVITKMLKALEGKTGLRVIEISPEKKYSNSEHVSNIEPNEFPSFFRNASYVVTNSFHGTVFSLIYNRSLFCFANPNSRDARITSLLDNCGILYRFADGENDIETVLQTKIDYSIVNVKLNEMRKKGINYLKETLEI